MSNDVETAVQSWIAETQMRTVQDYMSRGRRLEHSPEEALAGAWDCPDARVGEGA
ncbi:hypothetical protein MAE02_70590 [Microvirga aerophila]|uniref:Uncharacterized protein n=1 Tax=Microvirga aerophila TaxID=670291 RepID=A0A512C556_9HYPH|nr:hypothetical protein MAE02_70590 [Microvirga aerophila]